MKSIEVSRPVWDAIAARGKFGETEDDVLRRVLGVGRNDKEEELQRALVPQTKVPARRRSFATDKLSTYVAANELRLSFASGPSGSWRLPAKTEKAAIRTVRDLATAFAREHGATLGQVNAVKKALTDSGYFVLR